MRISVRIEGGLGDHFAANRFIPAIKEKYKGCKIDLFSDTEGNSNQSDVLKKMWPSHFENIFVIPNKKFKNFKIKSSNFPEESHPGNIKNVPDEIFNQMTENYDRFYDLHIDSLDWLNHDYNWLKYFHFFPKPEIEFKESSSGEKFILAHLYARDDADSNMEDWYIKKLLSSISREFKVVVLCDENSINAYQDLDDDSENIILKQASIDEIFELSQNCIAMFGVDSGIRYIPYHFGKPTFTFSKYCNQYGKVQYSYLIRWLYNEKFVFPLHYDVKSAGQIIKNTLKNPAYKLYPFLLDNIEQLVAQRDITEYIAS